MLQLHFGTGNDPSAAFPLGAGGARGDSSNLGRLPGSLTTHSGGSSTPSALAASALPASLARWIIARADIQYECRPDGSPVRLGEGARWAVCVRLCV